MLVLARNKNHWEVVVKQVVQAAYSKTSLHQQQWKAVYNVHGHEGEQVKVAVAVNEFYCSLTGKINLAVFYLQNLDFTNETNPADIPPLNLKFYR